MKKILFLPFLTIPTGHHSVANALIGSLRKRIQGEFVSIDFLSYVNSQLEKGLSKLYLNWISFSPSTYNLAYGHFVYPLNSTKFKKLYESMFLTKMERLLSDEQPDLIVCTQAYPSYLISRLKVLGKIKIPVINVYTDFFINNIWGREGIDYHFVPDAQSKKELVEKYYIAENKISITGIPVDERLFPTVQTGQIIQRQKTFPSYHVLIAGGNNGLGNVKIMLQALQNSQNIYCTVLCGNNKRLFKKISSWQIKNIKPLSYISSKREMALLYNQVDAIITKPGGVTISEALWNRKPIFVYSALPGQEQINFQCLSARGLVYPIIDEKPVSEQLLNVLNDDFKQAIWRKRVDNFLNEVDKSAWEKILEILDINQVETIL